MRLKRWSVVLALTVGVLSTGCPKVGNIPGRLIVDGHERTYRLYVPGTYKSDTPAPLVVALHPFGCDAELMEMMTGFNAIADREGFIILYPDGNNRMWNSNPGDPFDLYGEPLDDVAYIDTLIRHIEQQYAIDSQRIYLTGGSAGGLMTQRLAGELTGRFAAAAAVMSTLPASWGDHIEPLDSIPVLIIHGKEDPFLPWNGGDVWEGIDRTITYYGARQSALYWAGVNKCEDVQPLREELPDTDPDDGTRVFRETFRHPDGGAEVVLYGIRGGGHTWPGCPLDLPGILLGTTSYDINASEVIWDFFSRHRRN